MFRFIVVSLLFCAVAYAEDDQASKDIDAYVHELTGKIDDLILKVHDLEKKIELIETVLHSLNANSSPVKKTEEKASKKIEIKEARVSTLPSDATLCWDMIKKAMASKDLAGAKKLLVHFLEAFSKDKHEVEAHYWLGELLYSEGNHAEAQKEYALAYKGFSSTDERKTESALKIAESFFVSGKTKEGCQFLKAVRKNKEQGAAISSGSCQLIDKYQELYKCSVE
jgi:TolA-binding protein